MASAPSNGGKTTGKKLTKDQAKLAQVVQRVGAVDKKPASAPKKNEKKAAPAAKPVTRGKKPVGAYSKGPGVSNVKFEGKNKNEKFDNYLTGVVEGVETRKERGAMPSKLYAAARKLGIDQRSVKKLIDSVAADTKKYSAATEKKTSKQDMLDMQARSAANRKKK